MKIVLPDLPVSLKNPIVNERENFTRDFQRTRSPTRTNTNCEVGDASLRTSDDTVVTQLKSRSRGRKSGVRSTI